MPWAYLLRRVMGGETEGLALRACLAGDTAMIPDSRRFVNTAEHRFPWREKSGILYKITKTTTAGETIRCS